MTDAHHRAAIAERAARAGGAVARERFRADLAVETKANKNDLVTELDRDSQRQVVATVREEFPEDPFVGEEDVDLEDARLVDEVPDAGAAWVVDPIDGTTNYVHGNRTWATAVAAVDDGEPVGSATYLPSLGDLYAAGPDSATRDGTELSVSDRTDPETFVVSPVGWYAMDQRDAFGALCSAVVERFGDMRRIGCFQATLALVADGGLEGVVCTSETHPWDTMAGVHLVREAGGVVTDVDGDRWRHDSRGLVASNGEAHDALLEAAQDALDRTTGTS